MRKISISMLAALIVTGAQAQTYNLIDSFSTASSTNGPWKLGWRKPGTSFTLMNSLTSHSFTNGTASVWRSTVFGSDPNGFYRNFNNFDLIQNDIAASRISANDWVLHPEVGAVDAVARFTVPTSGLYKITSSAARMSQYAGDAKVLIEQNGSVKTSLIVTSNNYVYTSLTTLNLSLNAGDFLDFIVNENGDPSGDSTGFRAQIKAVPEPSSLLMLVSGGVLLVRRRMQRQSM